MCFKNFILIKIVNIVHLFHHTITSLSSVPTCQKEPQCGEAIVVLTFLLK